MKLSNILLFTGAAIASYTLIKHKDQIIQEGQETLTLVEESQANLQDFKSNLTRLQEELEKTKEVGKDLSYQFKVFSNEASARLSNIQSIWENKEETPAEN